MEEQQNLKGHWTTSASSPEFFFKKKVEIFILLEVYTYVVNCMLNLTCNFNSATEIYEFFFQ